MSDRDWRRRGASQANIHLIKIRAIDYTKPRQGTGIWLAGGAPTIHTLPPGGTIVLSEYVTREMLEQRMDDLVGAIVASLDEARDELMSSGILIEGPFELVAPEEPLRRRLAVDRKKHFGFAIGKHFMSGGMFEERLYDGDCIAIDLFGIRPDTLEEIALKVGRLLSEPAVLLLDWSGINTCFLRVK